MPATSNYAAGSKRPRRGGGERPVETSGRVLPARPRLDEGMALCARWGAGLPAEVTAFVAASRQAARHNRLRGAANFVALPVIVALFWAGLVAWGVRTIEAEMQFVLIPNGCFQMGSPDTETERNPDEGPVHKVCLRTFELGKFEVTQAE